ncbi:MAG: polyhydroxyalkanoic acid system family protein [Proteobacteria bacterium]|nr:polyhydroxyalkanoic acid system family protein [Pseudomonadota bacterium]
MKIKREHRLGKDEARKRVDEIAARLNSKFKLRSAWQGDDLKIDGSGVQGRIVVSDHSVDVELQLGFALKMFEGTIRSSIEEAMDDHLT